MNRIWEATDRVWLSNPGQWRTSLSNVAMCIVAGATAGVVFGWCVMWLAYQFPR